MATIGACRFARVISNHAYSYHEDRTRRHMVTSIQHMCIAYSVVTKYAFRNCASNVAQPSLARVPKSCPGTHTALQAPMTMATGRECKLYSSYLMNESGQDQESIIVAASVLGFSITDKTQSEMKIWCIESKQMLKISDERLPHPMCVCVILLFAPTSRLL